MSDNDNGAPERLDLGFGDGPAHRPLDARLTAGRRALRRRRAVSGVATLAVLAAVGSTYSLASGGGSEAGGVDPAAQTSVEPTPDDGDFATDCPDLEVSPGAPATSVPPAGPGLGEPNEDNEQGDSANISGGSSDSGEPDESDEQGDSASGSSTSGTFSESAEPDESDEPGDSASSSSTTTESPGPDETGEASGSGGSGPSALPGDPVETMPSAPQPAEPCVDAPTEESDDSASGGGSSSGGSSGTSYGSDDGGSGSATIDDLGNTPEVDDETPVLIDADGAVLVATGVEITRQSPNPLHLEAPDRSVALVYVDPDGARHRARVTYRFLGDDCALWTFDQEPVHGSPAGTLAGWARQRVNTGMNSLDTSGSDGCGSGFSYSGTSPSDWEPKSDTVGER